jgi:hypothetical protein
MDAATMLAWLARERRVRFPYGSDDAVAAIPDAGGEGGR